MTANLFAYAHRKSLVTADVQAVVPAPPRAGIVCTNLNDRFDFKADRDDAGSGSTTEYDVQTLMAGLLKTRFEDVRPEDWAPSYAGKSARIDFLLKDEQVMVETKMTRDGLNDAKLADELIIVTSIILLRL